MNSPIPSAATESPLSAHSHPGAAVRLKDKASSIEGLLLPLESIDAYALKKGECLVEVRASGVNMSDVKAALGHMPYAVWPRTPGRDYAGIVVEGSPGLVGKHVWGSSGELGIRRDGAHGTFVIVPEGEICAKPDAITLDEAGAIGVPFITAHEGLRSAGGVKPTDVVLVLGGNGKVGQAVIQFATMAGARVFAVERTREPYRGHATGPVEMIDAAHEDIAASVRDRTGGHGADIVYNTVGSPYFVQACAAMALGARQIFISTFDRSVPFDIFQFFRGRHQFIGVDSLALDGRECAAILEDIGSGFESGQLKPFPVQDHAIYGLTDAAKAYAAVWAGSPDRIVLRPAS